MHTQKEFKETVSVERAHELFFKATKVPENMVETIPIAESLGRILASDIRASVNLPSHRKSAVDGYAIFARETFGASQTNPIVFKVANHVKMGAIPMFKVGTFEAAKVTTGCIIPEGPDAVVMQEYTRLVSKNEIEVMRPVAPYEDVIAVGEDIREGEVVLRRGSRIRPQHIGVLTSLGIREIEVSRKPIVGILSTGDELTDAEALVSSGKTLDINRPVLKFMSIEAGAAVLDLGIAGDNLQEIKKRLEVGLKEADIIVTSAGTSVSEIDLVPEVINTLGKPGVVVHGVSIRPAYPTGLASINGKPLAFLSGYPVAAMIGFSLFVRPMIYRFLGAKEELAPVVKARTLRRIPHSTGLRTFVRVSVWKKDGVVVCEPIRSTGASVLTSMTRANGMVVIMENIEGYEKGDELEVTLFGPLPDHVHN